MTELQLAGSFRQRFGLELAIRKGLIQATDRHAAGCFLSYLERQGLSLADPESWKAYAEALHRPLTVRNHAGRKKLTAGGYNNRIQAARKVVKMAIELDPHLAPDKRDRLKELANANLPRMKDRRGGVSEERFITREQVLAMIQAAQAPTWGEAHNRSRQDLALWIEFLWTTGARISEATGILLNEINDVDHVTVRILLHGKGGLDRTVYCPRELVDRIRAHFLGQEYLFASKDVRSEGRYSRQHISNLIHACGKKALGRGFGAHTLRHSFATHALEQGVNIYALSGYLGHKKVTTTVTYYLHNRINPEQLLKAVALN